jgi:hypothetical protein
MTIKRLSWLTKIWVRNMLGKIRRIIGREWHAWYKLNKYLATNTDGREDAILAGIRAKNRDLWL